MGTITTGQQNLPRDAGAADWWASNAPLSGNSEGPGGLDGKAEQGLRLAGPDGQPITPGGAGNLSDPSAWMNLVGNKDQLTQWVQQGLGPNASPDLVNYYVGKVQGQPGANPTEQAGSANYWMQKLQSDPQAHGGPGGNLGSMGGAPSSGGSPWNSDDPSYGFRFDEGIKALQKSAASRGTLLTGGALKAISNYGQQAASQEYGAAFGRNLSLASLGENAAAQTGNTGSSYATNASNAITNNANAQGAAGIASANGYAGALNNVGNLGALWYLNKQGSQNAN